MRRRRMDAVIVVKALFVPVGRSVGRSVGKIVFFTHFACQVSFLFFSASIPYQLLLHCKHRI